jgi:hypothetical protein
MYVKKINFLRSIEYITIINRVGFFQVNLFAEGQEREQKKTYAVKKEHNV